MTTTTTTNTASADSGLDIGHLLRMSQAELDALYQNSTAGTIPVGKTEGTAIVFPGTFLGKITRPLIRLLFWQGKVFNPKQQDLLNRVFLIQLRAIRAKVYEDKSWIDGKNTIVLDYSKTSLLARKIRDEIREVAPGIYLGKVFWGRKRVLDFVLTTEARGAAG